MSGVDLEPDPAHPGYFLPSPRVVPHPDAEGFFLYVTPVAPTVVPSGVDALTANPRRQLFTYERLTRGMDLVGELHGVTGGRVTLSASATTRGAGSLTIESPASDIQWATERIRITANVEGFGSWGLGVYLPSLPSNQWNDEGLTATVQLMGLESVLGRIATRDSYVAAEGDSVIGLVRSIITSAGESAGALTDNGATLATDRVWPAGTWLLTIINDLLGSANHFPLWADGVGQFRAEPRPAPGVGATRWEFTDGPRGIYDPSFTHSRDLWSIPNVAIGRSRSTGAAEGDVTVVENADPDNILSTVHRGEVFTSDSIFDVDAVDAATLEAVTIRRLAELMSPASKVSLQALPVPLDPNDPCRFARQPAGIDARFTAQLVEFELYELGLMRVDLLEEVVL